MDIDLLFNGICLDILVDNVDVRQVEVVGNWQDISWWMGQYKMNYVMMDLKVSEVF